MSHLAHTNNPAKFEIGTYLRFAQDGQYTSAFSYLQPFVAQAPQNPDLLELVSECYWQLGMKQRSLSVLQLVVQMYPQRQQSIFCLAGRLGQIGQTEAAKAIYHALIQDNPDNVDAYIGLTFVEDLQPGNPTTERLRQFLDDPSLSRNNRYTLLTALGHILKKHSPDEAFMLFTQSNALQEAPYSPTEIENEVEAQGKAFKSPVRIAQPPQGNVPNFAFIVGLPRSGTTLLDAMLTRHPEIASTNESTELVGARKMAQTLAEIKEQDGPANYWSWTNTVGQSTLEHARSSFFSNVHLPVGAKPSLVINKLPHNRFELGFAQMILPQNRSIFLMRHPLDVGLSLFTTNLKDGYEYTRRLEWIGHMIRQTYRSLDDFKSKLGDSLRVQSYRALVTNTEPQMQAILNHLEMPWDPACMSPESSEQAMVTAYSAQVRNGVNSSGLGKWQKFECHLAPLIDALGGWRWIKDWEARDADLG
ncbi:sulfotransferase [Epibacterium ulvae]|uniref:tetratricopeptide repeat-containing sulfotransferase family protein n=1 Tax=Epibacterium ulvae TaxID=1156985 RepID=UPI001BFC1073|nr:sulfotransferase [Epibacterium ulvae]MBT8155010.1 sulfotransferase [Epibacterium ulvae]